MIRIVANGVAMDLPSDLRIQLTIENPIFSTDRIPVAYTTNIDFPATQTNLKVFGFQDKLFIRPAAVKVPATLYVDELRIVDGMLCFDSFEDRMIRASFVGAQIEDFLSKDLSSVMMQQWLFGPLTNDEKLRYVDLLNSAADGNEVFVCAPVATNRSGDNPKTGVDYINRYTEGGYDNVNRDGYVFFNDYYSPALRLDYLLGVLLSDNVVIQAFDTTSLHDIVLITGSKLDDNLSSRIVTGGLEKISEDPEQYAFSLSSAMPSSPAGDLLKEILKMFCLSVSIENNKYVIQSNQQIFTDADFDDWSAMKSDLYSIAVEPGLNYKYGFSANESMANTATEIIQVQSIFEMLTHENEFAEETYFQIVPSGEVYFRSGYQETDSSGNVTLEDYWYKWMYQGNISVDNNDDSENYDSTVNLALPRTFIGNIIGTRRRDVRGLVPLIDFEVDGGRLTGLNLALSIGRQKMVYKTPAGQWVEFPPEGGGFTYPQISATPYNLYGERQTTTSFEWEGENGLYALYHKQFAEWIRTDRVLFRTTVNLSVIDLKNLQLFRKKLIDGKKFLIRQIDVEIGHDGVLPADVQFVEAPDTE